MKHINEGYKREYSTIRIFNVFNNVVNFAFRCSSITGYTFCGEHIQKSFLLSYKPNL